MANVDKEALALHKANRGKLEIRSKVPLKTNEDLTLAYTPGVAAPCLEINADFDKIYDYTNRGNLVAVVTNGTAVLGLGDIGAGAGLPVMEGKAILFKGFAGVDAIPICLDTKSVPEIIKTIQLMAPSFGGINLEDIKAPQCFDIEQALKDSVDIPVFHDDQHGTAIVVGAGAACMAITYLIQKMGARDVLLCDSTGAIYQGRGKGMNPYKDQIAAVTNFDKEAGQLVDVIHGADVFIGVSKANLLTQDMIKMMNKDAIILAMANPVPEIMPDLAKEAGARVVATGRSDFPNQVNNLLAFPGIFRGALDVRATDVNEEMKIAAAYAIASLVSADELNEDHVITTPFDKRVAPTVAAAVAKAAQDSGVARNMTITPEEVSQHTIDLLAKL